MFRRSTFALNIEVEDSDSQETQCDELRPLFGCTTAGRAQGRKMKVSLHADQPNAELRKAFRATGTAMRK